MAQAENENTEIVLFPELNDRLANVIANRLSDIGKCFQSVDKLGEMLEGDPRYGEITAMLRGISACGRIAISATLDLLPLVRTDIPTEQS